MKGVRMADDQNPPQPLKAHTTEQGVARISASWWAWDDAETNLELQWPMSVLVYDQMRRTDAQVASVLRGVGLPIRRTTWRIDPAGARDEVVANVAENVGLPIVGAEDQHSPPARRRDRFSWGEHLQLALLMLPFGHMVFEQVYRVDESGPRPLAQIRKLAPRPPRTISEWHVAKDGGLIGIKQHDTRGLIPVKNLVVYVHDREGGNWIGTSMLRPAYKHWLIKDRLLRIQAQTIDRNGMGVPRYTAAENEKDLSAGLELARSWRSGDAAGAAIANGANLDLVGVSGTIPDAMAPIRYHDNAIAQSVLAHLMNLGQSHGTGSWALGRTFEDVFATSQQALADQIAETATQHIVEDLVDLNFGTAEPAPRIVCDPIDSDVTATAIKALIDAGAITPDEATERYLRAKLQLPGRDAPAETTPPQEDA